MAGDKSLTYATIGIIVMAFCVGIALGPIDSIGLARESKIPDPTTPSAICYDSDGGKEFMTYGEADYKKP